METPEHRADKNIFQVLEKIKRLQKQVGKDVEIEYRLSALAMDKQEEMDILKNLEGQNLVKIIKSWGSNSAE